MLSNQRPMRSETVNLTILHCNSALETQSNAAAVTAETAYVICIFDCLIASIQSHNRCLFAFSGDEVGKHWLINSRTKRTISHAQPCKLHKYMGGDTSYHSVCNGLKREVQELHLGCSLLIFISILNEIQTLCRTHSKASPPPQIWLSSGGCRNFQRGVALNQKPKMRAATYY